MAATSLLAAAGVADTPTEKEWQLALAATKSVALDAAQSDEHRANAVTAYARMQIVRGQTADALAVCRAVFDNPTNAPVAAAAIQAACHVRRHADGHLGGPADLIAQWERTAKGGASRAALNTARVSLARTRAALMSAAGRNPVPKAHQVRVPNWMTPRGPRGPRALEIPRPKTAAPDWLNSDNTRPGNPLAVKLSVFTPPKWYFTKDRAGAPAALAVKLPVYTPPAWKAKVAFPLLKEQKK